MTEQQTFWAMPAGSASLATSNPRKLARMHMKFGAASQRLLEPPLLCGSCRHLHTFEGNTKSYFKCMQYGVSKSEATDWRKKWEACGIWESR